MTSPASHSPVLEEEAARERVHSLPLLNAVSGPRCEHPQSFWITWETLFCGLCFLRDGYHGELPRKLHHTKRTLTTNGNPQQAGKLESHVRVIEGIIAPLPGQSLDAFARARNDMETRPAPSIFPFASALWELMGKQPPLAIPLALAMNYSPEKVAHLLELSVFNVNERLVKAIDAATRMIRKYDGRRDSQEGATNSSQPPRDQERNASDRPEATSRGQQPRRDRSRRR